MNGLIATGSSYFEVNKQALEAIGWRCFWDEKQGGNVCLTPKGRQRFIYGTTPSEVGGAWCYLIHLETQQEE